MEDTIDICSGCGKMPRSMDSMSGSFVCSRCGSNSTLSVKADDYERIASELDHKFHTGTQKSRIEAAASHPVELRKKPVSAKKKPAKRAQKAKPSKKRSGARKR